LFSLILMAVLAGMAPAPALAEKMDSETQNLVIDRLDRILTNMETSDPSWVRSNLRMADLLAERARLRFMNEIEADCKDCKGSSADRQRAIKIYQAIQKETPIQTQGVIMFQMAHLFEIAGDEARAISLFESILKAKKGVYSADVVTRARTALADIFFQKGKFKEALASYEIAMKDSQTLNKGLIKYRIAWCQFNLDRLALAIWTLQSLAQTPALLTKETATGVVADVAFQGDVLRDLATFYSRRPVTSKEIAQFVKLIPNSRPLGLASNSQRKELLFFFAGEVDRLGQKQAASEIYRAYLKTPGLTNDEHLEVMVLIAQTNYDKGSADSIEDFALAAQAYKKVRCSDDAKCLELQKKMKRYVTEVHRSKKVKPDSIVLRAYDIYVKTFPEETEMAVLGAQVAVDLNKHEIAASMYHEAARTAKEDKLREMALMGEIEAAEKSKDLGRRELAYKHYLSLMPKGPNAYNVRYQWAQVAYDRKDWSGSADSFRTLALEKAGPADLRKKSADLSLDALAIQKRDADLETWANEYALVFPAHALEFQQISRKALTNQVALTANDTSSSSRELKKALEKMQTANLAGASDSEKMIHYRNMSVLAEKTSDEKALLASIAGLLAIKSLSSEDREQALARQVGYFEKKLEFKSAYETALRMKFPKLKTAERELKLATLADLGGVRPQKHYEAALRAGLRGSSELSVRSRLVLLAGNTVAELKKQAKGLSRSPQILSETVLLVYARNHSTRGLESFLNSRSLERMAAIQFIKKQPFYQAHLNLDKKLSAHKLNTSNDRQMGRTIQERVKLLNSAETSLSEAIRLRDYTAQVMALTTMSRENERFTQDLLQTPMPKGLKPNEQVRYGNLLKQQAKPFLVKAKFASQKLSEFWKNQRALQALIKDLMKARPEVHPYLAQEARFLAALAPTSELRSQLENALEASTPSTRDLKAARDLVSENPSDIAAIEKLKNLETKIGHPLMISYLDGRLIQTQKRTAL
ncbi:MAG: tetratricopeptide repeat protein, partial [Bdellovibrio sp.]